MKALNYTPKAIESLRSYPCPAAPGTRAGLHYLCEKLAQAETFILQSGDLLDRSKPRPQVPGISFRPPFPVVALEFPASGAEWGDTIYTAELASRRIALAWEWSDDAPSELKSWLPHISDPGVVVTSIVYYDNQKTWMAVPAGIFLPYEGQYIEAPVSDFRDVMIAKGRIKPKVARASTFESKMFPIMPEALAGLAIEHGAEEAIDLMRADLNDEVNAYLDFCLTLACNNVRAERHVASRVLNKARNKKSKPPLKDFHILTIDGHSDGTGEGFSGPRNGPRAHLRRGHIRRLDSNRVTWVNATMVTGRGGFVDKAYAVRGAK